MFSQRSDIYHQRKLYLCVHVFVFVISKIPRQKYFRHRMLTYHAIFLILFVLFNKAATELEHYVAQLRIMGKGGGPQQNFILFHFILLYHDVLFLMTVWG